MIVASIVFHLDHSEGPAGQMSTLLMAHIITSAVAHAVFFLSFGLSIAHILQRHLLKQRRFTRVQQLLPSLEALDSMNASAVTVGFIFMTLGVGLGVIYALMHQVEF